MPFPIRAFVMCLLIVGLAIIGVVIPRIEGANCEKADSVDPSCGEGGPPARSYYVVCLSNETNDVVYFQASWENSEFWEDKDFKPGEVWRFSDTKNQKFYVRYDNGVKKDEVVYLSPKQFLEKDSCDSDNEYWFEWEKKELRIFGP